MSINNVTAGDRLPGEFNVIIEIPMNADPVKYEVDKDSGALFVDRFMMTAMHYPANYGYVPQTISEDEDPVDVLVHTPFPLLPGVVVRCRALGLLRMDDESGGDARCSATGSRSTTCPKCVSNKSSISSSITRISNRASGCVWWVGPAWTLRTGKSWTAWRVTPRKKRARPRRDPTGPLGEAGRDHAQPFPDALS